MGIYFVSPQAAQDLQDINDYLFAKNPDTANKFLGTIHHSYQIQKKWRLYCFFQKIFRELFKVPLVFRQSYDCQFSVYI